MTREVINELKKYTLGKKNTEKVEISVLRLNRVIKALEQEPCEDAISRQAVLDKKELVELEDGQSFYCISPEQVETLQPVTPKTKTGHWLRMSDLSEQEDDRYKCSRCGNVIHHQSEMNLYTFNSWCGRCGSDNGKHMNYEVEE